MDGCRVEGVRCSGVTREFKIVKEVQEKVQSPEKLLDDLEFMKDLGTILVKM